MANYRSPVDSPYKRLVMRSFYSPVDVSLEKPMNKQLQERWIEMFGLSFDVTVMNMAVIL